MRRSSSHQHLLAQFEEAAINETLQWTGWPERLAKACSYVFLGGGKRIRPILALSCANIFGDAKAAMPWGLAVELIHTYSLVHDDLPAMDDDDERRGKPTCHRQYDEGTAILVGDALLTRAFQLLCEDDKPANVQVQLIQLLSLASGGAGMVGGQVDDLFGDLSNIDNLVGMQMKKTGALLSASAVGGALAAGADPQSLQQIKDFGNNLGLLFQLTDDMIDKTQDAARDSNNFHHHMSDAAVLKWRDDLIEDSLTNLEALPVDTAELAALIHGIGDRSV